MTLVIANFSLLIGAVLFSYAANLLIKANPDTKIPNWWGRPANFPGKSYVFRVLGIWGIMFGSFLWSSIIGYWSLLIILVAAVPSFIATALHNRAVNRKDSVRR